MLHEPVRQLLERQAHILETDFLADDIERHGRESLMHLPHHAGQYRSITHAGIKQPQRRGLRMNVPQFQPNAPCHHAFLSTGVHEQQIFLAIVKKTEIAPRLGWRLRLQGGRGRVFRWSDQRHQFGRRMIGQLGTPARHITVHTLQCLRRDASAIAQSRHEFAVVDILII